MQSHCTNNVFDNLSRQFFCHVISTFQNLTASANGPLATNEINRYFAPLSLLCLQNKTWTIIYSAREQKVPVCHSTRSIGDIQSLSNIKSIGKVCGLHAGSLWTVRSAMGILVPRVSLTSRSGGKGGEEERDPGNEVAQ